MKRCGSFWAQNTARRLNSNCIVRINVHREFAACFLSYKMEGNIIVNNMNILPSYNLKLRTIIMVSDTYGIRLYGN